MTGYTHHTLACISSPGLYDLDPGDATVYSQPQCFSQISVLTINSQTRVNIMLESGGSSSRERAGWGFPSQQSPGQCKHSTLSPESV